MTLWGHQRNRSWEKGRPGLAWDWGRAALGAANSLPSAAVALGDPAHGLALSVGVLPASIAGLAPLMIVGSIFACLGLDALA